MRRARVPALVGTAVLATMVATVGLASPAHSAPPATHDQTPASNVTTARVPGAVVHAVPMAHPPAAVAGPTYDFTSNASTSPAAAGSVTPFVSALPFNFYFDVGYGLASRGFNSGTGRVCLDLKVYKTSGSGPTDGELDVSFWHGTPFGITSWTIGPTVAWAVNNTWQSWCWQPTSNGPTYYFQFDYATGNGNAWAHGDGTASPG